MTLAVGVIPTGDPGERGDPIGYAALTNVLGRLARDMGLAPAARQRMTAPERTAADDAAIFSTDF